MLSASLFLAGCSVGVAMSGTPDPNIRALAVGQSRDLVIEITGSKKTISVIVWTASCRVKGISPHLFIHNLQGVRMKLHAFLRGVVLVTVLVLSQGMAHAENWYATLSGGFGSGPEASTSVPGYSVSTDAEVGYAVMGAVGYRLSPNIRVEGEVSWRSNALDVGKVNSSHAHVAGSVENVGFMVNAAYDIPPIMGSALRPFVLGGVGIANVKGEISEVIFEERSIDVNADEDDTVFAYQGGVGVSYAVSPQLSLEVSFRVFGTMEPDLKIGGEGEKVTNLHRNGLVGLTYSF